MSLSKAIVLHSTVSEQWALLLKQFVRFQVKANYCGDRIIYSAHVVLIKQKSTVFQQFCYLYCRVHLIALLAYLHYNRLGIKCGNYVAFTTFHLWKNLLYFELKWNRCSVGKCFFLGTRRILFTYVAYKCALRSRGPLDPQNLPLK